MSNWHDSIEWKRARAEAKKHLQPSCATCNKDLTGNDWTIDHIVASNPPNHDLSNLQSMCRECNGRKSDKTLVRTPWQNPRWH